MKEGASLASKRLPTEKKLEGQVSGTQYKTENTTAKGKVGENTSYLC